MTLPTAPAAIPVTLRFGNWEQLRDDASALRFAVFVAEQGVPAEMELDAMDGLCLHAVAYDSAGQPLGTGRLLPDGHIGRMAVARDARGSGVGSALLLALMAQARARSDAEVLLSAQSHAAPFYARHGYVVDGLPFVEAGIEHVNMRYRLA